MFRVMRSSLGICEIRSSDRGEDSGGVDWTPLLVFTDGVGVAGGAVAAGVVGAAGGVACGALGAAWGAGGTPSSADR